MTETYRSAFQGDHASARLQVRRSVHEECTAYCYFTGGPDLWLSRKDVKRLRKQLKQLLATP